MNFEQGKSFVRDLIVAFPAFEDAARNSPDIGATHRRWIEAWEGLELAECTAVLNDLSKSGGIKYEDYKEPGPFIRRLVLSSRRNSPKSEADLAAAQASRRDRQRRQRDYVGSPMAAALVRAMHLRDIGADRDVIHKAIDRLLSGSPEKCDDPSW